MIQKAGAANINTLKDAIHRSVQLTLQPGLKMADTQTSLQERFRCSCITGYDAGLMSQLSVENWKKILKENSQAQGNKWGQGSHHKDSGNSDYKPVTFSNSRLMPVTVLIQHFEKFWMTFYELLSLSHFLISQLHSCWNAQHTKNVLLSCLEHCVGIKGAALEWFTVCLSDKLDTASSSSLWTSSGFSSWTNPLSFIYICTSGSIVRKNSFHC